MPQKDGELTDEEILDRVAARVTRMRLGVPAILFLESSKPLSFVGSQLMVFLEPFVRTFFAAPLYDRFAALMEDREKYELLIKKIEKAEADAAEAKRRIQKAERDGRADKQD